MSGHRHDGAEALRHKVRSFVPPRAFLPWCLRACFPVLAGFAAADPVLDPPTLHSLGVRWIVPAADPSNIRVTLEIRRNGQAWQAGAPLWRVEKNRHLNEAGQSDLSVPEGATLFAGSAVLLNPDTDYELRLRRSDADGPSTEHILKARTLREPTTPQGMRTRHVVPGNGGGDGSSENPFQGLAAANKAAAPGDLFLVHKGVYPGRFIITRSGEPGRPIIYRGDGEAILDGQFPLDEFGVPKQGHVIEASNLHDLWLERLSIRGGWSAIRAHESQRIVLRRCHITRSLCGVFASKNDTGALSGFFITDNLFEGNMPWPATHEQWKTLPESRAIWITGAGHVIARNRIHHFKDGIDTSPSRRCDSIDIHNNDISQVFDDGAELDGSFRNVRFFNNRIVDCLCGISFQPIHGGPAYAFRNVAYNIRNEPLKLHNKPSGAVIFHNTFIKKGLPLIVSTSAPVSHCWSRNNIFIGTTGRAANFDCPMIDCDFDYDGFGGFAPAGREPFVKFNRPYASPEELRRKGEVYRHIVTLDPTTTFKDGLRPPANDLASHDPNALLFTLDPSGQAIDAGQALPGLNDGFLGQAPDLGAIEAGASPPKYGPE